MRNQIIIIQKEYTEEDYQFRKKLYEKANFQRLAPIFILSYLVAIESHSLLYLQIFQPQRLAMCFIEQLSNFSVGEMLNISVSKRAEDNNNCFVDVRNYSEIIARHNFNYTKIIEEVRGSSAPSEKCKRLLILPIKLNDDGLFETYKDHYELYCYSSTMKNIVSIISKYGQAILCIPIGVFADYKGRKPAALLCGCLFTIGLVILLIPRILTVIISFFITGTLLIYYYIIYTVFIESATSNSRKYMLWVLHLGIAVSKCINWLMYKLFNRWLFVIIMHIILSILILVWLYLMPESPRYLYFKGYKKSAYAILGVNKPDLRDENKKTESIVNHFKNYRKPIFKKRIIMHTCSIFCASSIIYLDRMKFTRDITHNMLSVLLDSGIFLAIATLLTYSFVIISDMGKTITFYNVFSFCLSAILFINYGFSSLTIDVIEMVQLVINMNIMFLNFYCVLEQYPNGFKFTSFGILASIPGISQIFHKHLGSHDIHPKSIKYLALFLLSAFQLSFAHFRKYKNKPYHVADYEDEAAES